MDNLPTIGYISVVPSTHDFTSLIVVLFFQASVSFYLEKSSIINYVVVKLPIYSKELYSCLSTDFTFEKYEECHKEITGTTVNLYSNGWKKVSCGTLVSGLIILFTFSV